MGRHADPRRQASAEGKAIAALALLGLGNNAPPFALITWGQTRLPSGLASILIATTPLFTVLAAQVFTAEERLSYRHRRTFHRARLCRLLPHPGRRGGHQRAPGHPSNPATAVILGAAILNERLLGRQFLGFAIIVVALAFIDGRLPRVLAGNALNNSRLPTGQKSR